MSEAVAEIGAYGRALRTISEMSQRHAADSQAHARKARALRSIKAALDDSRWRDDVDADWLEGAIRSALRALD